VRSRGINCQVIVQSAAQLSDRYEKKEWEELVGNCDTQLFLGCNDQMTADYFSKKCGMVTIKVENNQMPLMPLFSPILNTTRPYSQTKSNTQRALMLPDEILRMPNEQALVLIRGQKPLMLYKIIPDELPLFKRLSATRIIDYVPVWRQMEDEKSRKIAEEKTIKTDAPMPEKQERPVGGTVKYSLVPEIDSESEDIDELEGLFATEEASPDEIIGK
jgi:type IV secretion system protein VirD4